MLRFGSGPAASAAALALLLVCCSCPAARAITYNQSMPPRLQWMQNGGYCGEVSTVASGLRYASKWSALCAVVTACRWGQYLSQYDVRDVATGSQLKYAP